MPNSNEPNKFSHTLNFNNPEISNIYNNFIFSLTLKQIDNFNTGAITQEKIDNWHSIISSLIDKTHSLTLAQVPEKKDSSSSTKKPWFTPELITIKTKLTEINKKFKLNNTDHKLDNE